MTLTNPIHGLAAARLRRLTAAALCLALAGCVTDGNDGSASLDDAISLVNGAAGLTNAAAGLAAARSASTAASGARTAATAANAGVAATNGYSQRGAFEDCARLYQQAGRPDLAQQCATRANNMSTAR